MHKTHPSAFLLLVLLALGLTTGCKGRLLTDIEQLPDSIQLEKDKQQPFLGIVLHTQRAGAHKGVRIERVLRESPADKAGFRPRDVLVQVGETGVSSSADVKDLLMARQDEGWEKNFAESEEDRERLKKEPEVDLPPGFAKPKPRPGPTSLVDVTLRRGAKVLVKPVQLQSKRDYSETRAPKLAAVVMNDQVTAAFPFLYSYMRLEVAPRHWLAYTGQKVKAPVVLYEDVDLLPLLSTFSLFRLETLNSRTHVNRAQIFVWPLILTFTGEGEDYFRELLLPGEELYAVH